MLGSRRSSAGSLKLENRRIQAIAAFRKLHLETCFKKLPARSLLRRAFGHALVDATCGLLYALSNACPYLCRLLVLRRTTVCSPAAGMADEAEVVAQIASLKHLLDSKLPAEKARAFTASDRRLLAKKGFYEEWQLLTATRDDLQGPPGDAVKPTLIRVLLTAFNPPALHQGCTNSAKHPLFSHFRSAAREKLCQRYLTKP